MPKTRILLIEDNPDDRLLIKRGISKGIVDHVVIEAHREELLEPTLEKGGFDIVVTDYNLGWTNGIRVLKAVKQRWPKCPVIMMTVMDAEDVAIRAMQAGLDNYIVKSSSQFALMGETIRAALEQKKVEEALSQSQVLNETVIASVQDGVLVTDQNLRIVVWNPYLEMLSGISQEEVTNQRAPEILSQAIEIETEKAFRKALAGETLFSSDTPYLFPISHKQGWFAITFAPLRNIDGEVIGVVANVHDITQRKEDETERERLLQAEQKRTRELAALTTSATTISSNIEIDQVLRVVAEQMIQLLTIDCCTISSWSEEQETLEILAEHKANHLGSGSNDNILKDIYNTLEIRAVLESKFPFLGNIDDPDLPSNLKHELIKKNIQSLMVIPMIYQNRAIGLIELEDHKTSRTFSHQEIFLAQMLGNQAAVALENARLFREATENLRREQKLNEITHLVNNSMDVDSILDTTNRLITDLFGGDMAAVMILDQKTKTLQNLKYYNAPPDAPTIQVEDRGLMLESLNSKQPILLSDYQSFEMAHPYWLEFGLTACMVVPLESTDILLGVIGVFSTEKGKMFTARDLEMAVSIGSQVTTALHKAMLYEETVRRTQELSALYDFALTSSSLMDTPRLLHFLQTKMQELISPDNAIVYLFDEEAETLEVVMAYTKNQPNLEITGNISSLQENHLIERLISKNQAINIGDIQTLSEPLAFNQLDTQTRSLLAIPLANADRLLGALCVQSNQLNHFSPEDQRLLESIVAQVSVALDNARLYEELEDAYVQTVLALANAVDVRDTYTNDHSQRIAELAHETGLELGMEAKELEILRWGSLLHDIGKIGVPDDILLKPGELTEEEYEIIKKHPELGASIVAPVKKLQAVAPIIHAHQEHFDGSGYPDGLAKIQIPLAARILTVVDSYVAMTDDRVYRKALSHEAALEELNLYSGKQFDPEVVKAFLKVLQNRDVIAGLK